MNQLVIQGLALLTLLSNILLVIFLLLAGLSKVSKKGKALFIKVRNQITIHSLKLAFIVSLTATSGSLYLSEVAGFTPCVLCWYQRIFMYPQVIILGIALIKKIKNVYNFTLPLSVIGGLIAVYNYYLQIHPNPLAPCSTIGFSVSCSQKFFTYFGYITIPWMAFSSFSLIIFITLLLKYESSKVEE